MTMDRVIARAKISNAAYLDAIKKANDIYQADMAKLISDCEAANMDVEAVSAVLEAFGKKLIDEAEKIL